MATKPLLKPDGYTVEIRCEMVALSALVIAFFYNESRKGIKTCAELLGMTGAKTPIVGGASQNLIEGIIVDFDDTERMITSPIGVDDRTQAKDLIVLNQELLNQTKELETLAFFKGLEGKFECKGKEVKLTQQDILDEWKLTFPIEIKTAEGMVPRISEDSEAVISGNRRLVCLIVANAVRRKAGETVVTHVLRDKRSYFTARDRKDDSIYLNERGKKGKLESTKLQKLGGGFNKLDDGAVQADYNKLYPGKNGPNRGAVQIGFGIPAAVRVVSFVEKVTYRGTEMTGRVAARLIREQLLDGSIPMPNQGKLSRLTGLRMQSEHSNGHELAFRTPDNKGDFNAYNSTKHLGRGMVALYEAHTKTHPEIGQRMANYFDNIRKPDWVDPVTLKATVISSVSSKDLQAVALQHEGPVKMLLNVAAGAEKGWKVADVANEIAEKLTKADERVEEAKLMFAVYAVDADGETTGEPLPQHLITQWQKRLTLFKGVTPPKQKKKKTTKKTG